MVSEVERKRRIGILVLGAAMLFIGGLIPLVFGFFRGAFAFRELFDNYLVYAISGAIFLTGTLMLVGAEILITKGDKTYGSGLGFFSPGQAPAFNIGIFKRPLSAVLLFSIIFAVAGLIFATTGQSFTGIGGLPQQFTAIDSIVFSATLVPISENLGAIFVLAWVIFILRRLAFRFKWSRGAFIASVLLIGPLAYGLYGLANHVLRYAASDENLVTVFGFWTTGGFITVITGVAIAFWAVHLINNLIVESTELFSSDVGVAIAVFLILSLVVWLGTIEFRVFQRRSKRS